MRIDKLVNFASGLGSIKVYWVDDKPETVDSYAKTINKYFKRKIECHVLEDLIISKRQFSKIEPCFISFDIKLADNEVDGITKVNRVRYIEPTIPLNIVSSFLSEYKKRLKPLEGGLDIFDKGQLKGIVFKKYMDSIKVKASSYKVINHYNATNLSWNDFCDNDNQEYIYEAHLNLFYSFAMNLMKSKSLDWICFVGHEVVDGGKDLTDFPDLSKKEKIAKQHGKMPFLYTKPIICEETFQESLLLDYYPTYTLDFKEKGHGVVNFDTGTNRTLISDEIITPEPGSGFQYAIHLGKTYKYYTNKKKINVYSDDGSETGEIEMPVTIIENWNKSPWTRVNKNRKGILARDIFLFEQIEICLKTDQLNSKVISKISKK